MNLPEFGVDFIFDNTFIEKFIKATGAVPDAENFAIHSVNDKVEVITTTSFKFS